MGEENELLKQISKPLPILSVFFTSILFLLIQQFLKKKKNMQLGSNLSSKWLNHTKKKFEDQNKN
jgi:hypothetical protein